MVPLLTPQKVIPQLPLHSKTQECCICVLYLFIDLGQLDSEHFKNE
jgi:hypothetical protein